MTTSCSRPLPLSSRPPRSSSQSITSLRQGNKPYYVVGGVEVLLRVYENLAVSLNLDGQTIAACSASTSAAVNRAINYKYLRMDYLSLLPIFQQSKLDTLFAL